MAKPKFNPIQAVAGSPFFLGGAASAAYFAAIQSGHITQPLLVRYTAGHPILIITTVLFFIGFVAQLLKFAAAASQRAQIKKLTLGEIPAGGQPVSDCPPLLALIDEFPASSIGTYFRDRLESAVEFVRRKGSANELDDELKYLSDLDADRRAGSHALVKVIIWAIPILGFLGTVVGLTDAISRLSPEALESSLPQVTAGLGVSFDTTALALGLAMVLMFVQFLVDRVELKLMALVDARIHEELATRFRRTNDTDNPVLDGVRKMSEHVLQACVRMVEQQVDLWQTTMQEAHGKWQEMAAMQMQLLEGGLGKALGESLQQHAAAMNAAEQQAAEQNRQHWDKVQQSLGQTAQFMARQQQELSKQGDVLLKVVEATGQVARLEEGLNRNLATLSRAGNFEDTMHSLSAAIHLLTSKLGAFDDANRAVNLPRHRGEGQAA